MRLTPWVDKYLPKNTSEVQGQNSVIEKILDFISNYKKQNKRAMLLHGPVGCGKTSSIHAIAKEKDLELIEVNASDVRTKDALEHSVGNATKQMSLFMKEKIILVDEADGISGMKDRGGIAALARIIKSSSFPILVTANEAYSKKLADLRKVCEVVEFRTLAYTSVFAVLKKIATNENVKFDEDDLKALARYAGGDLRAAINDLQTLASVDGTLHKKDIEALSQREKEQSIHKALMQVFKTTDPKVAIKAYDNVNEDFDKIRLWLEENLPLEYTKPEDLANAFDYLSKADVMSRRIRRWQHWRFLVYINAYLSAGVAVSKSEKYQKFISYSRPSRILKLWQANVKYAKRKAIAQKIAEKTHTSAKRVTKDTLPYLQTIFLNNKENAKALIDFFDFDKAEVEWLSQ
jgi:replication factor C large subunit